jgi:hypothetical protein
MLTKLCTRTAKSTPYPPCTGTALWPTGTALWRCLRRVTQPPHIAGPLAKMPCADFTRLRSLLYYKISWQRTLQIPIWLSCPRSTGPIISSFTLITPYPLINSGASLWISCRSKKIGLPPRIFNLLTKPLTDPSFNRSFVPRNTTGPIFFRPSAANESPPCSYRDKSFHLPPALLLTSLTELIFNILNTTHYNIFKCNTLDSTCTWFIF